MGSGIVEVFARSHCDVIAVAESQEAVAIGARNLDVSLARALDRNKISADEARDVRSRVTWTTEFEKLGSCELVVEAAPERLDVKREIFHLLDRHTRNESILATNTSSLSVTDIALGVTNPSRVIGLHFFNPAPIQKLVEIVTTDFTTPDTVHLIEEWVSTLGKTAVTVSDHPGFIVNRLLLAYLNSAITMVDQQAFTISEIDGAMRTEARFPLGPFELLDLIGLDTSLNILNVMFSATGHTSLKPAGTLLALVKQGHLGRKSSHGFYEYETDHDFLPSPSTERSVHIAQTLLKGLVDDAQDMVATGYASASDIDLAMTLGCGFPFGLTEVPRHLLPI